MESPQSRGGGNALEWRPRRSKGGWIGLAATTTFGACSIAAWAYAAGRTIAVDSFIAVVASLAALLLALLAGVLTHGYHSLRYRLEAKTVVVAWLWTREVIPLGRIDGLYRGQRLGKKARVEGLTWPGHYVGTASAEDLGPVRFYGTSTEPSQVILLGTSHGAYALTPDDPGGFRGRLVERLEALPEEEMERAPRPRTVMPGLLRLSLPRDGVAVGLLAAALLLLLASFGYVSALFPGLPELMPLHFNSAGEPDLIGPPGDAFRMPLIGLVILLANGVLAAALHGWQRDATRVLAAATVFVELVMLIAVLRVVH